MSAIPNRKTESSDKKSLLLVSGILTAIGISLLVYLLWYVAPEETIERVRIVAVTSDGCIAETTDGFAVNIGPCEAESGDYILAEVDQKVRDRAAAMNPTN